MIRKMKLVGLFVLTGCGATVLNGCLGAFWDGFGLGGWPMHHPWMNLAIDVLKEATIYRT